MSAPRTSSARPKRRRRSSHDCSAHIVVPAESRGQPESPVQPKLRFHSSWLFAAWVYVCAVVYLTTMVGGRLAVLFERWLGE